ncbi:DNA cytosine methyltransferase [Verrucomicrobia bacterium S94]|nr:DNA cytosine methyltransferase [Verrucomicrobia bacterium S94]
MIVYSVSDFSGNWSEPYKQAGYDVYRFDPKLPRRLTDGLFPWTAEMLLSRLGDGVPAHCDVLLMAPPCTDFLIACNRLWVEKDKDGRTQKSLEIVDACISLVRALKPKIWALENPVGRLWKLRPELGRPWYFNPCDYGEHYTKKTGLVGDFVPPLPLFVGCDMIVKPDIFFTSSGRQESYVECLRGGGENRRAARSNTPKGFAKAFFLSNDIQGAK